MHRLPPGYAPETARLDSGRSRGTRINRRASFATTGNAKKAGGYAVGAVWELLSVSAVGTLGCPFWYIDTPQP
jgi:hypothetical protein